MITEKPEIVLDVKDLKIHFFTDRGVIQAIQGIDFQVQRGEVWGLVGESASGKSVIGQALVGIVAQPAGRVISGQILFKGEDVLKKNPKELQAMRGSKIGFIPQDPTTALNPLLRVGFQVEEAFRYHAGKLDGLRKKVVDLMKIVHIPSPEDRIKDYPHQLSGGLKQRVIIGTGLASRPDILIADEPTSALDVTIQVQIIKLIEEIQSEFRMAMVLITHNLGLVGRICHRVAVLYYGRIVEEAATDQLFDEPKHPYTHGLLASLPKGERGAVESLCHSRTAPEPSRIHPGV